MIYSEIFRVFFTIAVFGIYLTKGDHRRCTLENSDVKDLTTLPLAYTFDNDRKPYFIYPEEDKYFTIDSKKYIVFSCPSTTFKLSPFSGKQNIYVNCYKGTQFIYNDTVYQYSRFICSGKVKTDAIVTSKKCAPNNNTVIDVGYPLENLFFPLYSVCFDLRNKNTLYTWHKVGIPYHGHYFPHKKPDFYKNNNIHGTARVDPLYEKETQRRTINNIMKVPENSNTYIDGGEHFITRGHFIPRTDFYYAREQSATFNYVNIFPQWYKCNVTWNEIEVVARRELAKYPYNRRVVVNGIYGTFAMPDRNNILQQLYLVMPQKQFAVPKFLWKLILDGDNMNNSVVFISYNHRKTEPEAVQREIGCKPKNCPGVMNNETTLRWIAIGLIYCCDIESFQQKFMKFNADVFNLPVKIDPPAAVGGRR